MSDNRPNSLTTNMATLHPVEAFTVPSDAIFQSGCRLEGSFYGSDGYRAARSIFKSGFTLIDLGSRARVLWFGPFPRIYIDDPDRGVPFLSSSEMMEARLEPARFVSSLLSRNLDALIVREGTILISRSGTIGNVAYCTRDFEGLAVTEHAIRVTPDDPVNLGLLYAFLQSSAGQFLIKRSRSGSVVESIYEADVSGLILPWVPFRLRERLSEMIHEVSRLRVEANALLDEAEAEVQRQCGLPAILPDQNQFSAFIRSFNDVLESISNYGSLRLDATAFDQTATNVRSAIAQVKHDQLRNLCQEIIYIGKVYRVPVEDKAYGAPLLSGKDLVMVRPAAEKYLSVLNARHIERCRLQRGWVLVSCSGNIGRVAMCYRNFEGFVGSEHMLRLICDETQINPFFVATFLSSPFGQVQMQAASYGSVIPEFSKDQLGHLLIAIPEDRGKSIGATVRRAYDLRADARDLEDEAIRLFETAIEEGKEATEQKWGREY